MNGTKPLSFKVGSKGAISVHFPGRNLPVTLYAADWTTIADRVDDLRAFIAANADVLRAKADA